MGLREAARKAYSRPYGESNEQALGLELALRLSGDTPVLNSTKKPTMALADSPAFRNAHPAVVGYLEEFGPVSGFVTPAEVEEERQASGKGTLPVQDEEAWQVYLGSMMGR